MAVRKFKPVTPGQRNKVISAFDDITCKKPEKSLLEPLKSSGGRNNQGKMTMRYIGGGHKKMYRVIDFLRAKDDCKATVMTIEYDPNRSARIALVQYDSPISNMKTLFYETLFDENASCHFAIGNGYPTCCKSSDTLSPEELVKHGLNSSLEHADFMVGTSDLEVEATLSNGEKLLVMKDGNFVI